MRKGMFLNKIRGEIKLSGDCRLIINKRPENAFIDPKAGFKMY